MKDMKMKTEIDLNRYLRIVKPLFEKYGSLWDIIDEGEEQNDFGIHKYFRQYSTELEFPDSEIQEFLDWLQECLYKIESKKGVKYAEWNASYKDLLSVALG
jgi:hypothetical protein